MFDKKDDKKDNENEVKLKVGELTNREEAGRGIIRLDSNVMKKLGIKEGEIVELEGTRKTGAIAVRSYPADVGLNLIRMDGITRRNAGSGVGETVKVVKCDAKEAKKVTLSPAEKGLIVRIDPNLFKQNIYMRAVAKGDIIIPSSIVKKRGGGMFEDFPFFNMEDFFPEVFMPMPAETRFVVTNTDPVGIVRIGEMTELEILPQLPESLKLEEKSVPSVTYEDVGGIRPIIEKVREMIELPLRHPELFERLGIDAPKGVLLYGPPGTGKTLLAKAVANESGANFISISGPEVMNKFYGESEANIRRIFEEAEKNAPSIIFLDEIDAIAPKREDVTGEVERRVVSQLLTEMDGLKARGKVVVIAATNRPNSLDPALRRAGRFDREIEFPVPDRDGRLEIFKIHTRNMPLTKEVNLDALADRTYGHVGADIMAICKEAAMSTLRRVLPEIKWREESHLPKETLEKLVVTKDDFDNALRMVEPSAMREVLIEIPKVKWEDIGGLEEVKQQLKEMIEWPLKNPDAFKRLGIQPPKGILLYGPPGCGKTMIAKAVASESKVNFISVKGPEVYCLAENTPILTSMCGLQPIGEVFRRASKSGNGNVIALDDVKVPAVDPKGKMTFTPAKKIYKLFVDEVYDLEFSNKARLTVSGNQPFMIFDGERTRWKKSSDLEIDDMIAVPSKMPFFDKEIELPLPDYKHIKAIKADEDYHYAKIFSTKSVTRLPRKLTPELAEFLGWFAAEGNVSKDAVSISNADEKRRDRIRKLFSMFVPEERIKSYKDRIEIYSAPLAKFLEDLFEMSLKAKSHTIKAPPKIFKSSQSVIASFLRGLYGGDGCLNSARKWGKYRYTGEVSYGTRSKALAQGLSYLLSLLGIRSKYAESNGQSLVRIYGKLDIEQFKHIVYGEKKPEARRFYNARHEIPDVGNLLRKIKEGAGLVYGKTMPEGIAEAVISGRKKCGLFRLRKIMEAMQPHVTEEIKKSDVYKSLEFIASGDISWVRLEKKNTGNPQWMYDLETGLSSFVGGELPFILHNSMWVGESERKIREIFRRAKQVAPSIIFLDEIDSLAPRRGAYTGSQVTETVVSQLLSEISGIEELKGVVLIAATNRPELIDSALIRPGRIDRFVLIPPPDAKARRQIIDVHTRNMPLAKGVDKDDIVKETEGFSGADIEALAREAAMSAIREDPKAKEVGMKHFREVLKKMTPSLTREIVDYYKSFAERQKRIKQRELEADEKVPSYIG